MASANTDPSWSRDEAADANPDLTRKRQRLSEETETSPHSTDGDVVIEALPPDEVGSTFDNAIALDDDTTMAPISDSFSLAPKVELNAFQQLDWVINRAGSADYFDWSIFRNLVQWLEEHLLDTRNQLDLVLEAYVNEHEFFGKLGHACFALLERQDALFDRGTLQECGIGLLTESMSRFHDVIYELSLRMLQLLPALVDKTIARRDSGQVAKTRQQIELLWYAQILGQTLCNRRAALSVGYCRNILDYKPVPASKRRRTNFLQQPESMTFLLALLKQLTQYHRELTNAWDGIDAIFWILESLDVGVFSDAAQNVMDIAHMHILPVICDKHPRALPDRFHELSVRLASNLLRQLASRATLDESAILYECYVKSENDALTLESTDDTRVTKLLQDVSGGDHDTLVELMTTAWTLARLKSFIYSDIMDVRSAGISLLSTRLLDLYNTHRAAKDNFEHPVLQYVARFMRANELTKYIFGPNSHASLVNHSQNIIGFLAATFAYTNLESDIIWHACTNSVETEFVKASFTVLIDLCRYLDLEHLLYLANKYAITPPSKLGKDAVESLTDLFQRVQLKSGETNDQAHRLATAFISIDIMMRVATVQEQHASLIQLRDTARTELSRFTSPAYGKGDRAQVFARCVPNLVNANENATTSVEIIDMFLPCIQSPQEAQDLLDMLPIQVAVNELGQYVKSHQKLEEDGKRHPTAIAGLQLRLAFVVRLMALPGVHIDDEIRLSLFRHTVGDLGLNNDARDYCWNALMTLCQNANVSATANDLIRHFIATEAIDLDLQFMTPRLIRLFGLSLQGLTKQSSESEDYSHVLEAPVWRKLVQAAESVGTLQVSQPATEVICDILFDYPRQSAKKRAAAAKCHADFARQQIGHIREDLANLETSGGTTICQKLFLLDAVLRKSRQFPPIPDPGVDTDICLATQPEDELFQCTVQLYCGGQTQPKMYRLQANSTTSVSELMAKLPSLTGATENRVIVGGKALDLESQSTETLSKLGVQASGGILISPKHTIESDLGIVLTLPGAVEQEVLRHFDDLEQLLDGPENVASKAYSFLASIPPPAQARQKVASPDTPVEDLFPTPTRPWRCTYSLYVTNAHRHDFAKIGVADPGYLLRGVHLLVAVLTNSDRSLQHPILAPTLSVLTTFLQERPPNALTASWIERPNVFVDRLIDICNFAVQCPRGTQEPPAQLLVEAFKALFQSFRVEQSVWKSFTENPRTFEMHKNVLFANDDCFPREAANLIRDFFVGASSTDEVAEFYTKTLLAMVPDALGHRHRAEQVFSLATEATIANKVLHSDESRVREMMESLISTLWSYQHTESVDLPVADLAMSSLLRLLAESVQIVKSFKKPLGLSNLPVEILKRLLFPLLHGPDSRPLVDFATRFTAYKLVEATCESEEDFSGVLDATLASMQDSCNDPHAKFPGLAQWIRPAACCSGLPNLGMTCYMNSLLQQLFANVRFRKFLFEVPIVDSEKQALLFEVQKLFAYMQDSCNPSPDTSALAKVLNIQTDSQEDVHGFYEDLLARLEANMPDDTWKTKLNGFYTGKQLSQIKGECGHVSPKTEPFVDLPVIIKNKTGLGESLDEFVQGEPMQGANKYKCQACDVADGGRLVDAMRRSCPEEIPDNLTFCLKRFTFEAMLGVEGKVNDRFEFPQTIDMTPYKAAHLDSPSSKAKEDMFELVGVIVHQGTLHLGHYWSYTLLRNTALPFSRTWIKLEDRNVSLVQGGIQEVQHECYGGQRYMNGNERADNAYVLFYERRASLEERIALPGVIIDPTTHALLPPRVSPPSELTAAIHRENAWRFRIAHLFHDDFAAFLQWLLNYYTREFKDQRLNGHKAPPSTDSDLTSDAESSAKSLTSDEELEADSLMQKVSNVAMTYLQRIAPCDNIVPGRRLAICTSMLSQLMTAQPDFAVLFVKRVVEDLKWFEAVIAHEEKKVRLKIGNFIISCLDKIREHDKAFYHRAFDALAQTHSKPKNVSAIVQSLDWADYLKFAASLASLGPRETEIVLDEGYWTWVWDLLYMPFNGPLKKKYPGLLEHFKQNPAKVVALYDFVHSILAKHIDIMTSVINPMPDSDHELGEHGLVMGDDEVGVFWERCTGNQNILKWMRQTRYARQDCSWRDSAPGKLVGLLCFRQSPAEMVETVKQSLIHHIEAEEEHLPTLVNMTMNFCYHCNSEDDALPVFKALADVMHMWDGSDKEFLKILPDAYQIVPRVVVATMDTWAPVFLKSKLSATRDETAKWLQEKVFNVDPASDCPDLDAHRARQARKLIDTSIQALKEAFVKNKLRSRYEGTINLVSALATYLQTLDAQFDEIAKNADGETTFKLRKEIDEIPSTMVALKELENDVLAQWPLEVAGTQGLPQDVRASVEESEEFVSSEDWDDDDDESVGLD